MIKINKDINSIPESLIPATNDNFPNGRIPIICQTTHLRRIEVINNGEYIDENIYNSRYKYKDIKKKLTEEIYNHKCAFCEQRAEQLEVEHYRPKKGEHPYYWLAYSWDNLLLACTTCNKNKGTNFEIVGSRVTFDNTENNIKNINCLSSAYNQLELPLMANPEIDDPKGFISFSKNGRIFSDNARFKYTVEKCKLDRTDLNDQRRKLLEDLKNDIRAELVEHNGSIDEQKKAISVLVRKFKRGSEDKEKQFLAFRIYALDNDWLNDLIKEVVNN